MARLGLEQEVVDRSTRDRAARAFREAGVVLPTFAQLADPTTIPRATLDALGGVGADDADPRNLFRVHWYNDDDRLTLTRVPRHIELPSSLTGVDARIVVALGNGFPMIGAHKVLAAYGCLAPRVVTGQFDPTAHRAIWPSTGNYCRGGVAISRLMGCHGVAVLPEGMSRERFEWLERWVVDPGDIVRTPGSESNVKEIYDACNELDHDPRNIIFNQFCEFGNHLVHWLCTGRALGTLYEHVAADRPASRLCAFVSATGSAGTIAAGDHLRETFGTKTVALEALECPTLLYNGFGEHNIQGIGDKHLPYIHNVMATDFVVAVSDRVSDTLGVLFNTDAGRSYLVERRGVSAETVRALRHLGLSSIANVVGAIKMARYLGAGPDDVILTVATDGYEMYGTERDKAIERYFPGGFDGVSAGETWGGGLCAAATDHLLELSLRDRERVFNLGYFTWVEQQGVEVREFTSRRRSEFWTGLRDLVPAWDALIEAFNAESGLTAGR